MPEQMLALGAMVIAGALVVHFLCELLLAWASTALVDANPSLARLCLFVVLTIALTVGAYYLAWLPIKPFTEDWVKAAQADGKHPWSLYALLSGVFALCSVVVVSGLSLPVLGTTVKQSVLVGVFVVLLRVLLWSLILGVVFVVFGFLQGFRGPGTKTTSHLQGPAPAVTFRA
jgi:hypothetical protein